MNHDEQTDDQSDYQSDRKYDDREPQRFLGMPVPSGAFRRGISDTEQRVLGFPRSWFSPQPIDTRWLRHPIRWTRWRLRVRRLGPYAGPYAGGSADRKDSGAGSSV